MLFRCSCHLSWLLYPYLWGRTHARSVTIKSYVHGEVTCMADRVGHPTWPIGWVVHLGGGYVAQLCEENSQKENPHPMRKVWYNMSLRFSALVGQPLVIITCISQCCLTPIVQKKGKKKVFPKTSPIQLPYSPFTAR